MNFLKKYFPVLTVGGSAVLLILFLNWGIGAGNTKAQAQVVLANAAQLGKAADYFYGDQNRFPTAEEFGDLGIMQTYSTNFPPQQFISTACPQTYVYKRISLTSYQLNFCLPAATGNYQKGWNKVGESK